MNCESQAPNGRKAPNAQRGQSLIIFLLLLPVLLAFLALVLDGSYLYLNRAWVQTAADAGALAGAVSECNGGDPLPAARQYVEANGAELDDFEDLYPDEYRVRVVAAIPVRTLFGAVLGFDVVTVRAAAGAEYVPGACQSTHLYE